MGGPLSPPALVLAPARGTWWWWWWWWWVGRGRCVQIDAMRCRRAHVRFVELLLPLLLRVHALSPRSKPRASGRPPSRWSASRAQSGPRHGRGARCAAPGHDGAWRGSWRAAAQSPRGPRRWPRGLRWWCPKRRGRRGAAATRCPRGGEGGRLLRPRPRRRSSRCARPPPPLWAKRVR
eukprot:scaffold56720_cov62-Phaeocystis_antarctica.AAC.4